MFYCEVLLVLEDCVQLWSELLAPLINMIKHGCKNKSALFILLIFH